MLCDDEEAEGERKGGERREEEVMERVKEMRRVALERLEVIGRQLVWSESVGRL